MAAFTVSYSKLNDAANDISANKSTLENVFNEFNSVLLSVGSEWESEAHERFRAEFTKLQTAFDGYNKILNDFSVHLLKASEDYRARDEAIMNDVSVLNGDALFRV